MEDFRDRLLAFFAQGEKQMVYGPIRRVRENPISVTARRSSPKTGTIVGAESLLEYDFYSILDFDPRVAMYGAQAAVLPWRDPNGRKRKYYPDALVRFDLRNVKLLSRESSTPYEAFFPTVYEVKPWQTLKEKWAELRPKFEGARAALDPLSIKFKVITERQMRPVFLQNVRKLVELKKQSHPKWTSHADPQTATDIAEMVRAGGKVVTPKLILEQLGLTDKSSWELRMRVIRETWMLVALCHFDADLIEPLSLTTPIWPGQLFDEEHRYPTPKWRQPTYDWYR